MTLSSTARRASTDILLRRPQAADGPALFDLVLRCPPLDRNSRYCNLLQVTHFADTSILAEDTNGRLVGGVTGYLQPDAPERLFVWQVAVAPEARGQRLAPRMLATVLDSPACRAVRWLETSITPDNAASWAAFRHFAQSRGADLEHHPWFSRDQHFDGAHDDEMLLSIGPLNPQAAAVRVAL